jgi:hypothetical protein
VVAPRSPATTCPEPTSASSTTTRPARRSAATPWSTTRCTASSSGTPTL